MSQGVVGDCGYSYGYAIAIKMTNRIICAYELDLQRLQRVWKFLTAILEFYMLQQKKTRISHNSQRLGSI